jgi:hypothetical protein
MNCQSNTFAAGANYFLNTIDDNCWFIQIGNAYGNANSSVNIYANNIGPSIGATNWQSPSNSYHPDGIVAFTPTSGGSEVSVWIWNNNIVMDLGEPEATGQVFCAPGTSSSASSDCKMFNNVFYDPNPAMNHAPYAAGTAYSAAATTGTYMYNNTIVHEGGAIFTYGGVDGIDITFANNVVSLGNPGFPSTQAGFFTSQQGPVFRDEIVGWNDNVYWPAAGSSVSCGASAGANGCVWLWNSSTPYATFTNWKTYCGCDGGSVQADPLLTPVSYRLGNGSPGIGRGENLSSLCAMNGGSWPSALCYDKPLTVGVGGSILGNARPGPSGGAWDAGAYSFGLAPIPPTGLSATVQ